MSFNDVTRTRRGAIKLSRGVVRIKVGQQDCHIVGRHGIIAVDVTDLRLRCDTKRQAGCGSLAPVIGSNRVGIAGADAQTTVNVAGTRR